MTELRPGLQENRLKVVQMATQECRCGCFGYPTRECHCTPPMIQRYISKISGPLLDRIEIQIEVPAVKYKESRAPAAREDSAAILEDRSSAPGPFRLRT
jgi:predicted ATPase with chaperone activity